MKIRQKIKKNTGIDDHETPGYQHHDGLHFEDFKHQSYKKLAEGISKQFNSELKILELGSGAGSLSYWLKGYNQNYLIVTADANKETINSPYLDQSKHFIIRTDENYHFTNNSKTLIFDLILSYEHLEHIQENKLDRWFKNLNKHSKSGTIFIGTASTLNYNDRVHVTLKDKEWWNTKFQNYGWEIYDLQILNGENKPFNFELGATNELIYQKI